MKKIIAFLITLNVMLTSLAFADVVTFDMGSYDMFGTEVPATVIRVITSIILIIMSAIAIFIIHKKFEKKATKIASTIAIVLCCLFLIIVLPIVLPSPNYHHGRIYVDPYEVTARNSVFLQYAGSNKNVTVVKSLLDRIEVANNSNSSDEFGIVYVEGIDSVEKIQSGKKYDISVTDYYTDAESQGMEGAIKTISIIEHETKEN